MGMEEIRKGIEAGFIDGSLAADERYLPRILTNNAKKQTKVLDAIISELEWCSEFAFSVAFITNSGVACLYDILQELAKKNIRGKILASQYQNFTEPMALRKLLALPNLELRILTDENFHAKGYLFKRGQGITAEYSMIVGSSNLTGNALNKNNEWNIKLSSTKDGSLIREVNNEFKDIFSRATKVTESWLQQYDKIYGESFKGRTAQLEKLIQLNKINPNQMQIEALQSIENLRERGENKGILISATGTGKTYLSAFDVKRVQPKKFLFIAHRDVILKAARKSYENVFGPTVKMGLYAGSTKTEEPYVFASIYTLYKDECLQQFAPDEFEYIVVDEVHRSGASIYQKVLGYFKPKFLLGMTATPERTDGFDIFKMFDHNIAYEIRLNKALEEDMLVPFHYHGITDLTVNGQEIDDNSDFMKLTASERVRHIVKKTREYGCDRGRVKGLMFCSNIQEANGLSEILNNEYNMHTLALTGSASISERMEAMERLETDDPSMNPLDYIITVDIFNEGVDIPKVNQIVMLRPTQSAIIFVQQLGRGLRKARNKDYLEVIDFIANYSNNFMIPIALYGDRSFNKDKLRRNLVNNYMPGASTVYFDEITKKKIFAAINRASLNCLPELRSDYKLLKYQLGRQPMMMDFVKLGSRDPYTFIAKKGSYYNFLCCADDVATIPEKCEKSLYFISWEVAQGRKLEEIVLLQLLLEQDCITHEEWEKELQKQMGYQYTLSNAMVNVALNNISMSFFKKSDQDKYGNMNYVQKVGAKFQRTEEFTNLLKNKDYEAYVKDVLAYASSTFARDYSQEQWRDGFMLYKKYSRKDVCKILGWDKNNASTMYGYRIKFNTCPIFVTYKKQKNIAESTRYDDKFIDEKTFNWMTRNRVTMESGEIKALQSGTLRIPLFVKQSDDEGSDFYYMGDMEPKEYKETTITNDEGEALPIVNIKFSLYDEVNEKLLNFFMAGE